MIQIQFGHAVWLWRRARGFTQAVLARRAGVSRPNLSAIERGSRDVTVATVHALAAALDIRPGLLVDGVPPGPAAPGRRFTRQRLDRVADAIARKVRLRDPEERHVVEQLGRLTRHRELARGRGAVARQGARAAAEAWMLLAARYPRPVLMSLIQRVTDRQQQR